MEKYVSTIQSTDEYIIRRMRFACWITNARDIHSEYVVVIAFPRQQWLHERAPLLSLYVECFFLFYDLECTLKGRESNTFRTRPQRKVINVI